MGGDGKLSRALFVAVGIEDAISGEVGDLAVGCFIAFAIGVPEVTDRFIDLYVLNS